MQLNKINDDTKASMKTRIITAIVMALTLVPCIVLGNYFHIVVVVFIMSCATFEIIRSMKKKFSPLVYIVSYLVIFSLTFWVFARNVGLARNAGFDVSLSNWFFIDRKSTRLNSSH